MKVLLGVSGGIAAYKAAELVRVLQSNGVEVQVTMTRSAQRFVSPLTFAALTGKQIMTSLWKSSGKAQAGANAGAFAIEHIAVAQAIDAFVVAPATANVLAKLAHGVADNFLTATYLATTAPVVLAPAMNVNMWSHPATQANAQLLRGRGAQIVEPDAGYLACGMTGAGRLASVEAITEAVMRALVPKHDLAGETVLITAGGTREPIDPVRFLGNRSSGRMGYALAEAATTRGARVTVVSAALLPDPMGCEVVRVETAAEMKAAVMERLPEATVVVGAAAVADFRARSVAASKLRRAGPLVLELEATEDIVALAAKHRCEGTLVISFAAEMGNLEANARAKLVRKGVDAVVANDVSLAGLGFDSARNAGLFVTAESAVVLEESSKREMAERIWEQVLALRVATPAMTAVR